MKKAAIALGFLCFLVVMFPQRGATQDVAKVGGSWDVTVRMPDKNVSEKWMIQQEGGKVMGTAKGAKDMSFSGTVDNVFLRVDLKDGDMTYKVRATVDNDSLDGSITMGKNEYLWSAKKNK
jgi:hypothetical protein